MLNAREKRGDLRFYLGALNGEIFEEKNAVKPAANAAPDAFFRLQLSLFSRRGG